MRNLKDAVVIVTGSGVGVGAASAKRFAEAGARVVINYSRSETEARKTEEACRALGADTLLFKADIAEDKDCKAMAAAAAAKWGRIDILVNNAGVTVKSGPADLESVQADDFQRIFNVNVAGPYMMTRAVVPHMRRVGAGAVVNVSSQVAFTGGGSYVDYAASKGALNTLTMTLARVLAPEIRVNAVCPGIINTRWMTEVLGAQGFEAVKRDVETNIPMHRISEPEEVADAIFWLATGATYVTGETILMDGGTKLGRGLARADDKRS